MPDLSTAEVAALAAALGLPLADDDAEEVAHRLNGFLDALEALEMGPPGAPAAAGAPAGGSARPARVARRGGSGRRASARSARPAPPGAGASDAAELAYLPAARQAELIRARAVSPVELVSAYLERVERLDGRLRSYITVCAEPALAEARAAEAEVARGVLRGPLHGIPFAVKDQFDTAGVRTTVGSRLFADRVPAADATVVARLRAAGGILLGKLNLSELAMGDTAEFPFGQPRNPWSLEHHPGGSSGGSGAATAAALCAVSLGEDTGGSIRGPAAYCGVVGLRPTWGRLSRAGCFPLAASLDAPGPIARTVEDCALVLEAIAGPDPADSTASAEPLAPCLPGLDAGVRGLRLGLVRELTESAETDAEVRAAVTEAARVLEGLGARVEAVSLPLAPLAGAISMALIDTEGAGRHEAALRARPRDLDRNTRRRLLAASLLPAALYHRAGHARERVRAQVTGALAAVDLLLAPASPRPAPRIADGLAPIASRAAAAGRFFTRRAYATPASLAGVPALSVPCGFSAAGLPIGLQVIGRPFDEATVLRAARALEQATDWHRRRPPIG